jgi:hypothetical protein
MNSELSNLEGYQARLREKNARRCASLARDFANREGELFEEWKLRVVEQGRQADIEASLLRQRRALAVWRHEHRVWWLWRIVRWAAIGASAVVVGGLLLWALGKM